MYESFEVQNFRGLSSLRLDDLARVNLITGQNNVGKTSVLEALYLHCGDYMGDLLLQLDAQRGLIRRRIDQEQLDEAPWNSLFPQFDSKQWITLNGRFANGEQRQTELLVLTNDVIQDFIQYIPDTSSRFHLLMRYQIAASDPKHFDSGEELLWLDSDDGYGAARANHKPAPFLSFFLAATVRPPPAQLADWFSVLTRRGQMAPVLAALRAVDPQLKALLVLSDAGVATLHGEGEEGRPLPLALMGEGMNRLISLILAIGNAPGGVVLIDQIENGLHYSVLPNMWRAVGVAARLFNTQVFATTHSYECITAAQAAFAENRDDALRLYRLERQGDDLRTIGIDAAQLATVVEMGWEVR